MNRKLIFKIVLLTSLMILLSSCSENDNNTIRISTMFYGEGATNEYYIKVLEEFQSKHPEITIIDESETSSEAWKRKVIESFDSGDEPDIVFYFTGEDAKPLIDEGKVVPIDEIKAAYPEYGQNIMPIAESFMIESDGRQYALPVRSFWEGLYVNKDIFDTYGLSLPTSWDDFIYAIEVLKENDVIPISVALNDVPHYLIENFILSIGGNSGHSEELNNTGDLPKSWVEGISLIAELYDMGAFPENTFSTTNEEATKLFIEKKAGMIIDGSWLAESIISQEDTVVVEIPSYITGLKKNGDVVGGFTSGFYISTSSWKNKNKRDYVVELVNDLTSEESISKFSSVAFTSTDIKLNENPFQFSANEFFKNISYVSMPIDSRISSDAWEYIVNNIEEIAKGEVSSKDVLIEAAKLNK
ncbi:MAG: ABC transporter substrate-binding protein [Lachnospirales bacterium]